MARISVRRAKENTDRLSSTYQLLAAALADAEANRYWEVLGVERDDWLRTTFGDRPLPLIGARSNSRVSRPGAGVNARPTAALHRDDVTTRFKARDEPKK